MMIVVLGDEVQMVDQAHGLFQPRMWDLSGEQRSLKPPSSIDKLQAGIAELAQDLLKVDVDYAALREFCDCSSLRR